MRRERLIQRPCRGASKLTGYDNFRPWAACHPPALLPRGHEIGYPLLMSSNLPYRSRAVRAMVLLHEEHLRRFVQTWRRALATSLSLPPTDDPAYASLGALGRHVLNAAGGYLVWMCEMLTLPAFVEPSLG